MCTAHALRTPLWGAASVQHWLGACGVVDAWGAGHATRRRRMSTKNAALRSSGAGEHGTGLREDRLLASCVDGGSIRPKSPADATAHTARPFDCRLGVRSIWP
eukprot:gnl/TRDRNA2_/TRDRNA2_176763_c1_seq3.p3 gnl/TRDRNA2_/TRDRNA2_176763_c1~~gnl/TRDRNA2_/TRDRNA2_176763_c1_seq3.p3  ORF type:complete len:103 (-),score=3.36 gnl/TRDRNA2_/TRDRNA2_176763_c1_seq3:432-740(-)